MDNLTIARKLLEHARLLQDQGENLYRIRSYRWAAQTILGLTRPLSELVEEGGRSALRVLPGVGPHLAYTVEELVRTGEFRTWDERKVGAGAA